MSSFSHLDKRRNHSLDRWSVVPMVLLAAVLMIAATAIISWRTGRSRLDQTTSKQASRDQLNLLGVPTESQINDTAKMLQILDGVDALGERLMISAPTQIIEGSTPTANGYDDTDEIAQREASALTLARYTVERSRPVLEAFATIDDQATIGVTTVHSGAMTLLGYHQQTRQLARLIEEDLRVATEDSNPARILDDVGLLHKLASMQIEPQFLISELIRFSIIAQRNESIRRLLIENALDEDALRQIGRWLNGDLKDVSRIQRIIEFDESIVHSDGPWQAYPNRSALQFIIAPSTEIELRTESIRKAERSRRELQYTRQTTTTNQAKQPSFRFYPDQWITFPADQARLLGHIQQMQYFNVYKTWTRQNWDTELTQATIAIRIYQLVNGSWPHEISDIESILSELELNNQARNRIKKRSIGVTADAMVGVRLNDADQIVGLEQSTFQLGPE